MIVPVFIVLLLILWLDVMAFDIAVEKDFRPKWWAYVPFGGFVYQAIVTHQHDQTDS